MASQILAKLSVGIKVAVVLTLVAIVLHIVGFSTTYWYKSEDGNEHFGLWEACSINNQTRSTTCTKSTNSDNNIGTCF